MLFDILKPINTIMKCFQYENMTYSDFKSAMDGNLNILTLLSTMQGEIESRFLQNVN